MTAVDTASSSLTEQQLGLLYQYTIEAYKTFAKLAENLPNPMTATKQHARWPEFDGNFNGLQRGVGHIVAP